MPEGDTVFKLAAYLGEALSGRELRPDSMIKGEGTRLAGHRIDAVFAHGKHLFIELDDHTLLRSHLGMWGSWHSYAPGEAWKKPSRQASILLDIGERLFVCFNAQQVELLRGDGMRRRLLQRQLGPDLLKPPVPFDAIIRRARELLDAATPIIDVLLDQRVATGIGNVYKSEVLFIQRRHPLTPLANLSDQQLLELYREAAARLADNLGPGPRITRKANDRAGRLWVYGRTRQPCLRCAAPIASARLGRHQRSTFWCRRCQPPQPEDDST